MRRVQPAEPVDPRKQLGGDPLHHPVHLAINIGMQSAEIGDARRRPHAAEKAVALDQQRAPPGARSRDRRRDPGRAATEDGDVVLAVQRHLSGGLFDGLHSRSRVIRGHRFHSAANSSSVAIEPRALRASPTETRNLVSLIVSQTVAAQVLAFHFEQDFSGIVLAFLGPGSDTLQDRFEIIRLHGFGLASSFDFVTVTHARGAGNRP